MKTLSDSARLEVSFELPVLRAALVSGEQGWRSYPLTYRVSAWGGKREYKLIAKVLYSSTCPCSASLSRQAVQQRFREDFAERPLDLEAIAAWLGQASSMAASPHAQRSEAVCEFDLLPAQNTPSALTLIDEMERALGTPVQAAVKREDEQEFARLNAANLMFCEDAAENSKPLY
ncbi:MAG: hypothetical protein HC902_09890 [Calothrix sp. SM1_5_4]|nr:hypothetical protein [Calothrix sp. SM1_5_4]